MSNIRYRSDFKSDNGTDWKVDILDIGHRYDTPNDFIIKSLQINYQPDKEDDLFAEILASDVSMVAMSENKSFDLFVNDLFESNEERFFMKIYKNNALYWVGQLLQDVSNMADAYYPQEVSLRATDGISYLKGLDFNSNGSGGLSDFGTTTFTDLLIGILSKIKTASVALLWLDGDNFIEHNVNWYDVAHQSNVSVLENTRINYKVFHSYDDDGNIVYMKCYDVLKKICEAFGMRVMLENGVWMFRQLGEYNKNSSTSYIYKKDGSANGTVEAINQVNSAKRLATQHFSYLPGLKSVHQCYFHQSNGNLLQGVTVNLQSGSQSLGSVTGGTGTYLLLSLRINIDFSGNTSPHHFFLVAANILIKFGSNYLYRAANNVIQSNDYSSLAWSSSVNYLEYVTEVLEDVDGNTSFDVNIQTPALPAGINDLEIDVLKYAVRNNQGTDVSGQISVDIEVLNGSRIEYYTSAEPSNKRCFSVGNNDGFSEVVELEDSIFGDAVSNETPVKLEVYDSSEWLNSTSWKENNTGNAFEFTALMLNERLALQRKTVLRREGTFKGGLSINDVIVLNHHIGLSTTEIRYFVAMRAALNVAVDEWDGVWFNIRTDRTTTVVSSNDVKEIKGLYNDRSFEPWIPPKVSNDLPDDPSEVE